MDSPAVRFLYGNAFGRGLLKIFMALGWERIAGAFLRKRLSKFMIVPYIRKHDVDMQSFREWEYNSFNDFFTREKKEIEIDKTPCNLIAPCDGLFSIYHISPDMAIPMKGSLYSLSDIIPDKKIAEIFRNGICLSFRLEASDYHHFCCFDDGKLKRTQYIPGVLHSVQPVAQRHYPVYRLNRRWWSEIKTENFGTAIQVEVGAMVVGGVTFAVKDGETFRKGDEMGNFELSGSTVLLLLDKTVKRRLSLLPKFSVVENSSNEIRVKIGEEVGRVVR